jgi:tubulin--tyrosine ligase
VDDQFVHLTNDAIQSQSEDYGKYETCNKLSFHEFEKYCEGNYLHDSFYAKLYPKIKKLIRDCFFCAYTKIDPHNRTNGFELYGFDIMFDED